VVLHFRSACQNVYRVHSYQIDACAAGRFRKRTPGRPDALFARHGAAGGRFRRALMAATAFIWCGKVRVIDRPLTRATLRRPKLHSSSPSITTRIISGELRFRPFGGPKQPQTRPSRGNNANAGRFHRAFKAASAFLLGFKEIVGNESVPRATMRRPTLHRASPRAHHWELHQLCL
jgi:hypothetical protein